MRIKIYLTTLIIFSILHCKQNGQSISTNNSALSNKSVTKSIDDIEASNFLLKFYTENYIKDQNEKSIENYVSKRLLHKMDSLSTDGNLILDYNPFLKSQDFDVEILKKTLRITPLNNLGQYRATFSLFKNKEKDFTNIDYQLQKNNQGKLEITSILNDEYLNFNNIIKKDNKKFLNEDYNKLFADNLSSPDNITNNLIFIKNNNKLEINLELLNYIQKNTTATNNIYSISLSNYVRGLVTNYYDQNDRTWKEDELFKIIAYASNTTDPLFKKYWKRNFEQWDNGRSGNILGFCNLVYHDQIWDKLTDNFDKNNYYNLPYLKDMIWYGSEFDETGAP